VGIQSPISPIYGKQLNEIKQENADLKHRVKQLTIN
jgi:hypothetical protein